MNFLEHLLSKGVQVVNVAHLSNNHFRCEGYRRIFWLAITAILGVCIPSAWILAMIFITGFEAADFCAQLGLCVISIGLSSAILTLLMFDQATTTKKGFAAFAIWLILSTGLYVVFYAIGTDKMGTIKDLVDASAIYLAIYGLIPSCISIWKAYTDL